MKPPKHWYRINNLAAGTVQVYLYDEIGMWGVSAAEFCDQLRQVQAIEIELHINSPGGDVFDGMAIYSALKSHPARVSCYVDSLAASAASFVAMAGDRIVMRPNAQMMIHEAHGVCVGNREDMARMADQLDRQSGNIAAVYATRTGGDVKQWRERMAATTWYMAAEAVAAGLADEVEDYIPPADMVRNTWDMSIFGHAGHTDETPPEPDVEPPAEPETDNPAEPEPLADPTPPADEPAAPAVDNTMWAAITAALTTPAPPTVEGLLKRLREGLL